MNRFATEEVDGFHATRTADPDPPKSANINTKIAGTSSAPLSSANCPVVVFLHGFMGNAQDWSEIASILQRDFECLALDLPGHGAALVPGSEPFPDMHTTAHIVARWLEDRGVERYSLVGYSMGGRLALYMALRFPQAIQRLVLESASPGLRDASTRNERRNRDEALAQRLECEDFEAFLREWYAQPLFTSLQTDPARLERIIAQRLDNDPAQLARSLRTMGTGVQPSLWDELSTLSTPTLLLVGSQDEKFKAIARAIAEQTPSARVQLVPNCGHNIHYECPNLFAETLRTFCLSP